MKLNFRKVAIINALILFSLALIWMFAPNILLSSWGVEYSYAVGMLSRRGAATYAGLVSCFSMLEMRRHRKFVHPW